jgi:hypothetical protein
MDHSKDLFIASSFASLGLHDLSTEGRSSLRTASNWMPFSVVAIIRDSGSNASNFGVMAGISNSGSESTFIRILNPAAVSGVSGKPSIALIATDLARSNSA